MYKNNKRQNVNGISYSTRGKKIVSHYINEKIIGGRGAWRRNNVPRQMQEDKLCGRVGAQAGRNQNDRDKGKIIKMYSENEANGWDTC